MEYIAHLLREECVIDLGEHFIKRSERNRTRILATGGPMELTVHVRNADRPRQPMREVRLDYSKRWPHQHWLSLVSAYRSSPYFDHYAERFEPLYRAPGDLLAEFNLALLRTLLEAAKAPCRLRLSEHYVEAQPGDVDLRPKHREGPAFEAEPYIQVFSDRMPFVANLSFIDLLFAEGPQAAAVAARSRF
ncbi:hypothetical protein B5F90_09165 [Alistipes sp. An31A]|nr:hypothetical protein B5F90_09165 [Alistipes sp. An31A]